MRGPLVNSRSGWLAAVVLAVGVASSPATADTCYRDESGRIVHRRQPGYQEVPCPTVPTAPATPGGTRAVPTPESPEVAQGPEANSFPGGRRGSTRTTPLPRPQLGDFPASEALPDRWHIVDTLPGYSHNPFNPYDRNVLKADRPIGGNWFFDLGLISDSAYQIRDIASAVGTSSTRTVGENDVFGSPRQNAFSQSVITEFVLYRGDTVFLPPVFEFRATPVFNYNYLSTNELEVVNELQRITVDDRLDALLVRRDLSTYPALKRIGNWTLSAWASLWAGVRLNDVESGYRVFRAGALCDALSYYRGYKYSETVEVAVVLCRLGYRVRNDVLVSVPIYRSRTSLLDAAIDLAAIPAAAWRVARRRPPRLARNVAAAP